MNQSLAPHTGTTATEGFGERSLARTENAAIALAEQSRAAVQARFVMAERRPRDMDDVRIRLLKDCNRRGFAEVARYSKPVGGKAVQGPSIRFVEAALRHMGNVLVETLVVHDDPERRELRVTVTDLESNSTHAAPVTVEKTVERREPKGGEEVLSSRTNSQGRLVYVVRANEDALLVKQAALVSKQVRTLGLRIVPGDIVEEAQDACIDTMKKADGDDPDAARRKLSDGFARIGIMPSDLKEYLGHDLAQSTPAELQELRALFAAIRDGEASWAEALATKGTTEGGESKTPKAVTDLREKLEAAKRKGAKPKAEATMEQKLEASVEQAKKDREPGED